ncbi:putative colanic acid biosynthesis acetyltransferase [Arcticibacter sp.]|jgi:putative colanic acid biosynthesis acetyltransferase WcaF|uniref:putative colanic acid biosynthesis acetyltransferase n=1 Tax=Arcticibacter sp. TaxID=1872630 RepID=UPI00389080AA
MDLLQRKQDVDPYLQPTFTLINRLRRLLWIVSWALLCRWTPRPLHVWRAFVLRVFGARIGRQNAIYPDVTIWAPWLLHTEDVVRIGPGAEIYNPGGVYLSHHVTISQSAYICGATHDYNSQDFTYITKEIKLEPYVWICARATLLPGAYCEEGSVLGAGSLSSKKLKAWTVYAGNPARAVRLRNNFLEAKDSEIREDFTDLYPSAAEKILFL